MSKAKTDFALRRLFDASAQRKVSVPRGLTQQQRFELALVSEIFTETERSWLESGADVAVSEFEKQLKTDLRLALYQPEKLPEPKSKLAVVSIAVGKHIETLKQTRALRAAYAKRIGADHIELTDDRWPQFPMANKWRLAAIARRYDRVLYVDSDVVIKRGAPNIFSALPADSIGLCDEMPTVIANGAVAPDYLGKLGEMATKFGRPAPRWCPNGGVMVLPREWAHVYEAPSSISDAYWCYDQNLLAVQCELHKAKVTIIDDRWNWGWIDRRFWEGAEDAFFIHANGTGSADYRKEFIDRMIARDFRRYEPPKSLWRPPWNEARQVGPKIGFQSGQALRIGGTESWHMTMIPEMARRLPCEGMSVLDRLLGPPHRFSCRIYRGDGGVSRLAHKVDVLIAWGTFNLKAFLPRKNPPVVISVHHGDRHNEWSRRIVTSQSDDIDCFVAINPEVEQELRERYPNKRIEYIPNAVDPARIAVGYQHQRVPRTVLWAHRFGPEKRVQLAIEAARAMPDWRFVIVGEGESPPVNPPPNCMFPGALPTQADWLAVADVFLSTVSEEGFGLSVGEAMLAGVPVVSTPYGLGTRSDLVQQLPPDPTPRQIAAAIRRAEKDRHKTSLAKSYIQEHHSIAVVADQWERLIRELAEERARDQRNRASGDRDELPAMPQRSGA